MSGRVPEAIPRRKRERKSSGGNSAQETRAEEFRRQFLRRKRERKSSGGNRTAPRGSGEAPARVPCGRRGSGIVTPPMPVAWTNAVGESSALSPANERPEHRFSRTFSLTVQPHHPPMRLLHPQGETVSIAAGFKTSVGQVWRSRCGITACHRSILSRPCADEARNRLHVAAQLSLGL